jgi:large subunit ribosomal protein L23
MSRIDHVIIRPLLSEKSATQSATTNAYAFEVGAKASKIQIKDAVQRLFGVRVKDVRTAVVRGKLKRFGRHFGKQSNWKKAFVTLEAGESLDLYGSA